MKYSQETLEIFTKELKIAKQIIIKLALNEYITGKEADYMSELLKEHMNKNDK
jgi:hypothetical protein